MINKFRTKTLGLSEMSRWTDYLTGADGRPVPVLYGFSRHVVPVPRDYPEYAHVTGYWFLDQAGNWEPPADLAAFLAAGEPPVYIGFGSMGFGRHAAVRGRIVLDAVDRVGVRVIVARGWGGLEVSSSSSRVHVTDSVPHDWLFPRTAAVVHHGGAGDDCRMAASRTADSGLSGTGRSRLLGWTNIRTWLWTPADTNAPAQRRRSD